jgi:hypothetical protein
MPKVAQTDPSLPPLPRHAVEESEADPVRAAQWRRWQEVGAAKLALAHAQQEKAAAELRWRLCRRERPAGSTAECNCGKCPARHRECVDAAARAAATIDPAIAAYKAG